MKQTNIVYKMIHLKTPNILNRKESVYDNENKPLFL